MKLNYPDDMSKEEAMQYVEITKTRNPHKIFTSMDLTYHGDEVVVEYTVQSQPFERIRRITGYLVGTLDRFNDAKYEEVKDRKKHEHAHKGETE